VLGNSRTIKASREQTGGAIAVLEGTFRPGSGAPAHLHHQREETFYVLQGEFSFRLGTQALTATTGAFVFVPRNMPQPFRMSSASQAEFWES
jgi:quercetin dioxygenase-like cupin family protein